MSAKIQTQLGHAIPPAPYHSITVHLPLWENTVRFSNRDPVLMGALKSMYPRFILHKDIKELTAKIIEKADVLGQACLLFSSPEAANACVAFATSSSRGEDAISEKDISVRIFDVDTRVGVSSRLAEESLKNIGLLRESSQSTPPPKLDEALAHTQLRERIASLLERAPAGAQRVAKLSPDELYLFQTGMASIYNVHRYLLDRYNGQTVLFGFAFQSTINVFEYFGPEYKFLRLGTAEEIDILEGYLRAGVKGGRKIQAVWAEFPSNPLTETPDLGKLRKLADIYEFALIIDDTIGSFCNVDLLGAADILITSLTKSFSGYADVIGASAVLNPSSARYSELKKMFKEYYKNEYNNGDAIVMESNSRNYLSRSAALNNNALRLVEYLHTQASDPNSSVARVYYPSINESLPNYQERMRSPTEEFTPGYGCLFSVELKTVEQTIAFYDNLNVHQGPHFGAHLTIAIPYVRLLYGQELEWAGTCGLRETQVRIAVGLEDTQALLEDFRIAVKAADTVEREAKAVETQDKSG